MKKKNTEIEQEHAGHKAYLGVGANLGDRIGNIRGAVDFIHESTHSRVIRVSRMYETKPYGYLDQDNFLNCVLEIQTVLTPEELIHFLLNVENLLKRERTIPLGPRTIDLDILFYDNLVTASDHLVIPHPRLHERKFVLIPLCDVVPGYIHPVLKKECRLLAETLKTDEEDPVEYTEQLSFP